MPLTLATIVDGTPADAADVNQYKTAIQTLAGASWNDGTGDLDVEELSDKVKSPGTGLEYSGGNLRIAAAAAGAGLTGGAGSALAVQVDNATIEIPVDTLQVKNAGISVAKMAASALSGKGNTAARPAASKAGYLYVNTQTVAVERDTGAAYEEVVGLISAANVTDLTDGGQTTLHTHILGKDEARDVLYVDHQLGGGNGVSPAAFTEYAYLDPGGVVDLMQAKLNMAYLTFNTVRDTIEIACLAQVTADPGAGRTAYVHLIVGDGAAEVSDEVAITSFGAYAIAKVEVDVSTLTTGRVGNIEVKLRWTGTGAGGGAQTIKIKQVVISSFKS